MSKFTKRLVAKRKQTARKERDPLIGQIFGELYVLERLPDRAKGARNIRAVMLVECSCKKRFTCPRYYLIRKPNPKTHCGCKRKGNKATEFKPEYNVWYMMNVRCNDPKHVSYKNYGGRGIKVCEKWHANNVDGFDNFRHDMGRRPSMRHTLDRIDPNKGYDVFNCRWTTNEVQAANKR